MKRLTSLLLSLVIAVALMPCIGNGAKAASYSDPVWTSSGVDYNGEFGSQRIIAQAIDYDSTISGAKYGDYTNS